MKIVYLLILTLFTSKLGLAQCEVPQGSISNIDCSMAPNSDIITGGGVNNGEVKYLTANNLTSNIAVGTGGTLYICGDITLSIGSGSDLLSLNGGTLVISSCATVTLNSGASPTYINAGSQIVNYGTLNITQSGSFIRVDNGAKLFNYAFLNMEGITFLRDGSIINDNAGNYSYIETVTMRMGSGGSTVYALPSSKLCLAENSCLENSVLVNATNANWLEYGGGAGDAYLYGTTNLTGNGGSISNDSQIQVCTTDNDSRWGATSYAPVVGNITTCLACTPIAPCNAALPIELTSFQLQQDDEIVGLFWETSSEKNNDYFVIQRLVDGIWEEIGRVSGSGNSTTWKEYSFKDENPVLGVMYYRLQQFDYDGRFDYSQIRSVQYVAKNIEITPNPANEKAMVMLPDFATTINVRISDISGKVVIDQELRNTDRVELDLSQMQGLFIVVVSMDAKVYTKRLICN